MLGIDFFSYFSKKYTKSEQLAREAVYAAQIPENHSVQWFRSDALEFELVEKPSIPKRSISTLEQDSNTHRPEVLAEIRVQTAEFQKVKDQPVVQQHLNKLRELKAKIEAAVLLKISVAKIDPRAIPGELGEIDKTIQESPIKLPELKKLQKKLEEKHAHWKTQQNRIAKTVQKSKSAALDPKKLSEKFRVQDCTRSAVDSGIVQGHRCQSASEPSGSKALFVQQQLSVHEIQSLYLELLKEKPKRILEVRQLVGKLQSLQVQLASQNQREAPVLNHKIAERIKQIQQAFWG